MELLTDFIAAVNINSYYAAWPQTQENKIF